MKLFVSAIIEPLRREETKPHKEDVFLKAVFFIDKIAFLTFVLFRVLVVQVNGSVLMISCRIKK
jgi:hypothetical protein